MQEKLSQQQVYEGQLRLLRYLQQMQHEDFQGLIVIVGQEAMSQVFAGDMVRFISDDGFDKNGVKTDPEDMYYIIKQDHLVEVVDRGDERTPPSLKARGSRIETLPEGKPFVLKSAIRE